MGKSKIEVKTRLHESIYRSCGGGQTKVVFSVATGPRNLIKAIEFWKKEKKENAFSYGNLGCGRSWIEIDGKNVDPYAIETISDDQDTPWHRREYPGYKFESRTEKARQFLESLREETDDLAVQEVALWK